VALADLREQLLVDFGALLAPLGYRRREQTFGREQAGCRWLVHIAFIKHPADFDLTMDVAIRHHGVEELLHSRGSRLPKREQRHTATIGVELGNLVDGRGYRWTVVKPDDVSTVVPELFKWYKKWAVPFFERFEKLTEVERVLDEGGPLARLISPVEARRATVLEAVRQILATGAA
jgi:hypothetical protein